MSYYDWYNMYNETAQQKEEKLAEDINKAVDKIMNELPNEQQQGTKLRAVLMAFQK